MDRNLAPCKLASMDDCSGVILDDEEDEDEDEDEEDDDSGKGTGTL